ncbi:MAG: phage head closure protein [Ottowia sp.]
MQAGTLDQRIELQELVEGFDDYGQPINEWQTRLSSWAAVEPLTGREYLAAMQAQSETTIRVRLRYRPGIKSAMRVKHGAKLYGIQSVIDVKSTGRELVLMCKASG